MNQFDDTLALSFPIWTMLKSQLRHFETDLSKAINWIKKRTSATPPTS
jgi:hypothetical protein